MKFGWVAASLVLLALFGFTIWLSLGLSLSDALGPGPGFFPFWLAVTGALLSVVLIVETVRQPTSAIVERLTPAGPALLRILAVIAVLAACAAGFDFLGWRVTALVLSLLLLPALGARSPLVIVPFALIASFGVFHVFYYWLKVPLPIGTFGI